MPAVTMLLIFGLGTAMQGNLSLIETPWILWSIILIIISAYSFMAHVAPVQKKIFALANDPEKFTWDEYEKLSKKWDVWGSIATLAPYIAVILMVIKP